MGAEEKLRHREGVNAARGTSEWARPIEARSQKFRV